MIHPIARSLALIFLLTGAVACSNRPERKATDVRPTVTRDVPAILNNVIGSMVNVRRVEPVVVSGYGLVVGLRGTGGGVLDERVALTMERELALRGVSTGSAHFKGTPFEGLSPRALLNRPDVAVAVVYAAIPVGAPKGAEFDVYVRSVNNSGTASLEGGTLWTTDLHVGPPTTFGGYNTRRVGTARGPVFINPFAEPPKPDEDDPIVRSTGRVLSGGIVTDSTDIALTLDNPSHTRAKAIQEAIRSRFPEGPGDDGPVARGRGDTLVEVRIPESYRDRGEEFLSLLLHVPIDPSFPQERARRYVAAMKEQPALVGRLTWCLEALGKPAVPFIRDLYESSELGARFAALRAGVALQDARAAAPLQDLARSGAPVVRADAIRMLGKLDAGPTVDLALRELLVERELDIRVAAYEALADRSEAIARNQRRAAQAASGATVVVDDPEVTRRTRLALAGNTIQGVERYLMEDSKFLLDIIPVGDPLIYITQSGTPRIALFGADLNLARPTLTSVWSGRLMLTADSASDDIRVFYRDPSGASVTGKSGNTIPELIQFMAHTPTPERPEPGLGMSYAQVVGALYALQQAGGLPPAFATEEDKLLAMLLKASQAVDVEERPETPDDRPSIRVYEPVKKEAAPAPAEKPSLVEPLPPRGSNGTRP